MSNKYPGSIITSGANAGYSVAFDGTGDFLTVPNNSAFLFGTGDFTVEFWVNFSSISATYQCIAAVWQGSTNYAWNISINNANVSFAYGNGGSSGSSVTFACTPTTNTWAHFAVTRASNSVRCFLNGAQIGTTQTISNNLTSGTSLYIGANQDAGPTQYVNGYVSNLRIIKGTALYTAAFTPPTQLLAITNTSLLTCNSPAIVDQSSNNFPITANGNAAVSTFTPFTGTQLVPNPNTLANTQGVWSISDAAYWMSQNKWPMPPNYPLQSLRFNSADSAYLSRTPASAGNRKTFTISFWVKRVKLGVAQKIFGGNNDTSGSNQFNITFQASDTISLFNSFTYPTRYEYETTQVFRDVSAWYHFVFAVDTTQASSSNRVKIYVNGSQITTFSVSVDGGQNTDWQWNSNVVQGIGAYVASVSQNYSDVYFADIINVDGQALTPSSFGASDPNTGVWSPVPYSGTYGTNGFRLSFQNNTGTTATTLGRDYSGNGNNWTPNNFSVAAGSGNDSLTDGPTNWGIDYGNGGEVRGNYMTINPLSIPSNSVTLTNGNLDFSAGGTNAAKLGTFLLPTTGKWFWEVTCGSGGSGVWLIGIANSDDNNGTSGRLLYSSNGTKYTDIGGSFTSYGASYTTGDVIGIAVDMDAATLTFYKNGVSQGVAFSSITTTYLTKGIVAYFQGENVGRSLTLNAGQRPFAYPAPSGFKVLCTTNLPIPTVGATSTTQANDYFNVALYTGNGTSSATTQSITGVGFQPDLVWIKNRGASATYHVLTDAVRGVNAILSSNDTLSEGSFDASWRSQYGQITAFGSDGFTVAAGSAAGSNFNYLANTYVGWAWNAGGSNATNTNGTITSTVRANTTAGISVVTYSGVNTSPNTVGHGLGAVPKFWLIKNRSSSSGNWVFNYVLNGVVYYMFLNTTATANAQGSPWSTLPSSSVVTLGGNDANTCQSGSNYVMYAFAEVAGFSKFGSYTGNGSTDGPFVYCGFRPRYIMIKRTDVANDWEIWDTARNTYNVGNLTLAANLADAEYTRTTTDLLDILSNGVKVRASNAAVNASGGTYIFMAFAEAPFNYSRAR